MVSHVLLVYTFNVFVVVLNICNPLAGMGIASRCVVVNLGISIPLFNDVMSSIADSSGRAPVALIEIFWAIPTLANRSNDKSVCRYFFKIIF